MMGTMEINTLSQQSIGEPGISSLIFKGTSTTTDRDAGFCSGGDEDDLEIEDDLHSPTDTSEDSVEVKVTPILSRNKNKRKCAEPRKVSNDEIVTAPLKKRIRFELKKENGRHSPFRPWNASEKPTTSDVLSIPPSSSNVHPVIGHQLPSLVQQNEPLSLVKTIVQTTRQRRQSRSPDCSTKSVPDMIIRPKEFAKLPIKIESQIPRVPHHPDVRDLTTSEIDELSEMSETSPKFNVESLLSLTNPSSSQSSQCLKEQNEQKEHRNYKNMTRERRIEANARERTRVHTISAAFDTLRKAIPAYSHNQKLSKLSVLRIACSYILTLSRVAENDYSADQSAPSLASCVDLVSRTIQTEGKLRKKKDE